jgi:hypothetical protein
LDNGKPFLGQDRELGFQRLRLIEFSAVIFGGVAVVVDDQSVVPIAGNIDAELDAIKFAEFGFSLRDASC